MVPSQHACASFGSDQGVIAGRIAEAIPAGYEGAPWKRQPRRSVPKRGDALVVEERQLAEPGAGCFSVRRRMA